MPESEPQASPALPATASASTLTQRLAAYWSEVHLGSLPPAAVKAAKRALLDTLAVGVAGSQTEVARAALAGALSGAAGGAAVVWGTTQKLAPPLAALVNGIAAHALEMDDFSGAGHLGACAIPALVAISAEARVSGADALVAIAAGYDVGDRVAEGLGGYRAHNDRGWHSTGTCGTFAAAATGARALGLEAKRYADALGVAGTYTGGTWAFLADGSMTKRYHAGRAAESGVLASQFAAQGFDGPAQVLEATWGGLLSTYAAQEADPAAVVRGLGEEFKILDDGIKPYACCRSSHGAVEAILSLMAEEKIAPQDVERIVYRGSARSVRQLGGRTIETALDGQFSLPYTLAVAAVFGRVTLDLFRPLRTDHPEVVALMDRCEMVADREPKVKGEGDVELVVKGRHLRRQVAIPLGDPRNMLSEAELWTKARGLFASVLGKERALAIRDLVGRLEEVEDLSELARLLAP